MSKMSALVRALLGPLELEARKGYPDEAVMGQSIGQYARGWAARARAEVTGRRKGVISKVAALLGDYGKCDAEARRERAEEARRLLMGLDGKRGAESGRGGRSQVAKSPSLEDGDGRRACGDMPALQQGRGPAGVGTRALQHGQEQSGAWLE